MGRPLTGFGPAAAAEVILKKKAVSFYTSLVHEQILFLQNFWPFPDSNVFPVKISEFLRKDFFVLHCLYFIYKEIFLKSY